MFTFRAAHGTLPRECEHLAAVLFSFAFSKVALTHNRRACTLVPGGMAAAPPGAQALLSDEALKRGQECREVAGENAALVGDEEGGQSTRDLLEFQGWGLLATRQVSEGSAGMCVKVYF